ncbi:MULTISPECIES: hypothetical protein [Lactobacillaceae]|uniref:hypothetical protein n=1 Tax=Lactobacillaceae TaxID=33958 RepID=UPI00079FF56B|nr:MULTISPECIES: hypothetical protein [Lactobacillaceae]MBZ3798712.1 hypothetical protein [Lacticaseibacillus paracasei]MCB5223350.1 hypothetical protein [Lactiplantibacillus pentosus]
MIVSYLPRGCKAFFKKHAAATLAIKQAIQAQLQRQVVTGMTKVKPACSERFAGERVWECRVNQADIGSVRLAFIQTGATATVLLISPVLQKNRFTQIVERFIRGA